MLRRAPRTLLRNQLDHPNSCPAWRPKPQAPQSATGRASAASTRGGVTSCVRIIRRMASKARGSSRPSQTSAATTTATQPAQQRPCSPTRPQSFLFLKASPAKSAVHDTIQASRTMVSRQPMSVESSQFRAHRCTSSACSSPPKAHTMANSSVTKNALLATETTLLAVRSTGDGCLC
ncbi:MAG: hypothetical protein HY815_21565 [Candidatus Riflebacteria bacterium]|nr:hypothetical protein [Candidatus Riflebacteria bacterium]